MKTTEVFTPGTLPRHTYVSRDEQEKELLRALGVSGYLVAVTGPSKSGKTVLCEHVLGDDRLIMLPGGGIREESIFWERLRSKLAIPSSKSTTTSASKTSQITGEAKASLQVPLLASGEGKLSGSHGDGRSVATTETYSGLDGLGLLYRLRDSNRVLVVDDFQYIPDMVRRSLSEQFKEAARQDCKIILVSVDFRADAVVRSNPDLLGRVVGIPVPYWTPVQLHKIALQGFPLLKLTATESFLRELSYESLRSPQLMQAICLSVCQFLEVDETQPELRPLVQSDVDLAEIFRRTAMLSNCQSLVDVFIAQATPRHSSDPEYLLCSGKTVLLAEFILRGLAYGKERALEKSYQKVLADMEYLRSGGKDLTRSVIPALDRYSKAQAQSGKANPVPIEWDRGRMMLHVTDPYFMFYMRWGKRWANQFL